MKKYIDLYLLPVPKKDIAAYKKIASRFGKIIQEYGALYYGEFTGEDLNTKGSRSFSKPVNLKPSEILTSAIAEFKSRKHRDLVMKKMFEDPRMKSMMREQMIGDMKRMYYGGFEGLV